MTSSQHGSYALGYTRYNDWYNESQQCKLELISKNQSQWGLQAAYRLHERGAASNRRSAYCGEYIPNQTHPTHHRV